MLPNPTQPITCLPLFSFVAPTFARLLPRWGSAGGMLVLWLGICGVWCSGCIFNNDTVKADKPIKGFGYDIYKDDAVYIHQPHIPAVGGNNGFSTEAKAKKAAGFVAYKIEHNIMPPSVTPAELDSLGVLEKRN